MHKIKQKAQKNSLDDSDRYQESGSIVALKFVSLSFSILEKDLGDIEEPLRPDHFEEIPNPNEISDHHEAEDDLIESMSQLSSQDQYRTPSNSQQQPRSTRQNRSVRSINSEGKD